MGVVMMMMVVVVVVELGYPSQSDTFDRRVLRVKQLNHRGPFFPPLLIFFPVVFFLNPCSTNDDKTTMQRMKRVRLRVAGGFANEFVL